MASAQVKRRQEVAEAGRRKLEQFRKQKAAKKASSQSHTTTQPTVAEDSDGVDVAAAPSMPNETQQQVPFSETHTKSESSQRDESVGTANFSSSLELRVNNRIPEVVPYSNIIIGKQSSERFETLRETDGGTSGSTLLSTSMQMDGFMHGTGLVSSQKDSLQPTTMMAGSSSEVSKNQQGSGEPRGGSIVHTPSLSSSYFFSSRPSQSSDYSVNILNSSSSHSTQNEADLVTSSGGCVSEPSSLQNISVKRDSNGPSLTSAASGSPYPFENYRSPLFPVTNGVMPGFSDYSMPKQNDDFSTLEQHIEDLTQEKFSLQRDLDASRALAESLASENSSITDTYNQQRSIVNQLKDDMEKLHQQIQAQMGELESVRNEYANAQLECNAADERSQILASEVISLEDKALRLRSNELKLERELEDAQSEMSSYEKKLQSLEKDRQDLQSTIKALQEEKKVLQTMVQKASAGGKSTDLGRSSTSSRNASTSTEGLVISDTMPGSSNQETDSTVLLGNDSSYTTIIHDTGQLTLDGFPLSVPADQMRVIENINTLIAELAIEKEELVQALSTELSQSVRVKELNKELSRKLEVQTQRLELLTAQNMAIDNVSPAKHPDSHVVQERPPIADEGDEVVERVLGWIMKMFPGGPSKRRTSKRL
ncbi:unnamed protein product [Eruca vesicaria subsp. sativa]|uniref:BLISTER n=1 Tax=Eruca vesicaria subsp. sativa TaxID=29727 RepID=A0ABC8L7Z3_ERUVS|nr:unnamed protein product [Eruca vesicaria subsp. sativa]